MNIEKLVEDQALEARFYLCGKCQKVYQLYQRDLADACCHKSKCKECGCEIDWSGGRCKECAELERARAADIVKGYKDGPMYCEGMIGDQGDSYFSDFCYLVQVHGEEEIDLPCYVYACKPIPFKFDVVDEIETYIENESVPDHDYEPEDYTAMAQYMRAWIDKQPDFGVEQDTSRIIVLNDERFKTYLAGISPQKNKSN